MVMMDDPGAQFIVALNDDRLSALIEVMYLVGFADGVFEAREKRHFQRALALLSDGRADEQVLDEAVRKVGEGSQALGLDGYIAQLGQRLGGSELRQIALVLASDVAAIDGVLHPKEELLLRQLAAGLSLAEGAIDSVLGGFRVPPSV